MRFTLNSTNGCSKLEKQRVLYCRISFIQVLICHCVFRSQVTTNNNRHPISSFCRKPQIPNRVVFARIFYLYKFEIKTLE